MRACVRLSVRLDMHVSVFECESVFEYVYVAVFVCAYTSLCVFGTVDMYISVLVCVGVFLAVYFVFVP